VRANKGKGEEERGIKRERLIAKKTFAHFVRKKKQRRHYIAGEKKPPVLGGPFSMFKEQEVMEAQRKH